MMLTFLVNISYAHTIHIPGDFDTIQDGIDAATNGDIVMVHDETWKGDKNKNLLLENPDRVITVTSENGAASTIIDCEGVGRGFTFDGESSVVNGFTIMNGSETNGGGIACQNSSPIIVNNIIINNTAAAVGGGIVVAGASSNPMIIGNIIARNLAANYGGGICAANDASPTIINSTITENSAGVGGGGLGCPQGNATVLNSIIWGASNGGDIVIAAGRTVNISYSDYGTVNEPSRLIKGPGMLHDVDPLFVGGEDYHITDYSPCVGAGTMTGLPPEALTDLDGHTRPSPLGPNPDIGADENPDYDIPLAVALSAFTATSNGDKVILKWRTESEINNLGFKVYRSTELDGDYIKVTPTFIVGAGTEATPREYSFTDEDVAVGSTYYYYIEDVDFSGKTNRSHIIEVTVGKQTITRIIPIKSSLFQNFPNPFNPETWMPYQLAQDASVTVCIYNLKGQLIRTIALGQKAAGTYLAKDRAVYWDGRDNVGEKVASGMYFYTLQAGEFIATRRMVIIK